MILRLFIVLMLCALPAKAADEVIEFQGKPTKKVQVSGSDTSTTILSPQQATEYSVSIVRSGDQYLWKSRDNTPMSKHEAGAFITYTADNGAGYVRIINPSQKDTLCSPGKELLDCQFTYVEHMLMMMSSITYYGE